MKTIQKMITVQTTINASAENVWEKWNNPIDIIKWYNASDDWHTPKAENDLRIDGKFNYRMEAKDGSVGFNFNGIYTDLRPFNLIEYKIEDGRKVSVSFKEESGKTTVTETFEPETINSIDLQQQGWQAILNNLKKYVESL
jgi:uncharacterized protein YndB with AHSA1/START domain